MDLRHAKKILDKINRLYDTMTMDDETPDVFERDLMLSYIRQLYAAFGADEVVLPEPPAPPRVSTYVKPPPPPPSVEEIHVEATPPAEQPIEEIKVPEIEVDPEPIAEVAPPPPPAPEPILDPPAKKKVVKQKEMAPPSASLSSEEHEMLFEQKEASELSEKLSQQPIKDIYKAMGINERVFTLKELFGGDKQAFDRALGKLNGFSHFDEAKQFLTYEIAGRFDWLNPSKTKKAKNFIKLVRRRYK